MRPRTKLRLRLGLGPPEEGQLCLDDRRALEEQQPGRRKELAEERHEEPHVHEVLAAGGKVGGGVYAGLF